MPACIYSSLPPSPRAPNPLPQHPQPTNQLEPELQRELLSLRAGHHFFKNADEAALRKAMASSPEHAAIAKAVPGVVRAMCVDLSCVAARLARRVINAATDHHHQRPHTRTQFHPVIRTHPETGKRAMFVSEGFTTAIEGWAPAASEALLQRLYAHCAQPAFVYRHQWREGDMVFWDNRCTLHLATGSNEPRTLYRTTIKG